MELTPSDQSQKEKKEQNKHIEFQDDQQNVDSLAIQNQQHNSNSFYMLFPSFALKSYTFLFISLQIIGFTFLNFYTRFCFDKTNIPNSIICQPYWSELEKSKSNCITYSQCTTLQFGARYAPSIVNRNQYWRLFSSLWIYEDGIQLIMNVFASMLFGFQVENYYGVKKFTLSLLIVGVIGNTFSMTLNTQKVYSGASASIFGLYGMHLMYIIQHYNYMGEDRKQQVKHFLYTLFSGGIIYFIDEESDSQSLPFSFFLGFCLTFAFMEIMNRKVRIMQTFTKGVLFVLILGIFYQICNLHVEFKQEFINCG